MAGFPGTRAALWQQVGRAGRGGRDALGVLVARDDPLDTYLVNHPEALLGAPVEANVFDPDNPYVLGPHLCAAASELPLTEDDLPLFGPRARERRRRADRGAVCCAGAGTAGSGPTGGGPATWPTSAPAAAPPVRLVEDGTGRLLGTVDAGSAHGTVHAGAVYLHQGETYLVLELDLEHGVATVVLDDPDYSTTARDVTDIEITGEREHVRLGRGPGQPGRRTRDPPGRVVPAPPAAVGRGARRGAARPARAHPRDHGGLVDAAGRRCSSGAGLAAADLPGAAHAAEHASIGLLPLFATCDRWDIGGVSTALHPDTGRLTVFVYDGHPGGAGFAERGFHAARAWLDRHPRGDRRLPLRGGLPVVRTVAQVREPEQPARQARRGASCSTLLARRRLADRAAGVCRSTPREEPRLTAPEGTPMLVLGLILILRLRRIARRGAGERHGRQGGDLRRRHDADPRGVPGRCRRPADLHHGPRAGALRASGGPTRTARPRRSCASSRSARMQRAEGRRHLGWPDHDRPRRPRPPDRTDRPDRPDDGTDGEPSPTQPIRTSGDEPHETPPPPHR